MSIITSIKDDFQMSTKLENSLHYGGVIGGPLVFISLLAFAYFDGKFDDGIIFHTSESSISAPAPRLDR